MAEGRGQTAHTAGVPAVIQIAMGRIEVEVGDGPSERALGSWIHLPAGTPRGIRAPEPSAMLLTLLKDGAGR